MSSYDLQEFSGFVSDIYDCSVDESLWVPTLERLCSKMGGVYVTLGISPVRDQDWSVQYTSPFDPQILQEVGSYAPNVPGLSGIITSPVDVPLSALSNISEEEALRTPFFRDCATPHGLRDGCIIKYIENERIMGTLTLVTGLDREPITFREREIIRYLSPHVRRAMMIGDSIKRQKVRPDAYRAHLEALELPILITDGEGRLRFLNAAGDMLLSEARLLTLNQGKVEPVSNVALAAFAEAVACAASNDTLLGRRGVGLRVDDGQGRAQYAYILPIGRTQARTFGGPGAAIFITASERQRPPPVAVLMTMLDIDPGQARILLAMAEGKSIDEAAEALGIGPLAVRTTLLSLYDKLNVSRPADLARIAKGLSFPSAIDPAEALGNLVR